MSLTNNYLLKQGSVLLLLKLTTSFLALSFYYLLAKQLEAAEFGLFSLAMSCLLFTTVVGQQGLEQTSVKLIAINRGSAQRRLYWIIFGYALASSCFVALVIVCFSELLTVTLLQQSELLQLLPFIALLTILKSCLAINSGALKGKGFAGSALLLSGFLNFFIINVLIFTFGAESAYDALWLFFISTFLALGVSFILVLSKFKNLCYFHNVLLMNKLKGDFLTVNSLSHKLLVISLMALVTNQLSILILASHVSLEELGAYSLAVKISMLLGYPIIVMNAMTAPQYAKLFESDKLKEFKALAFKTTKLLILIATIGVSVALYVLDDILAFFGDSYSQAVVIVWVLLVGQWFNLATGSVFSMLIMSGYESLCRRNTVIITSINVVLLFVFIPEYGVLGAAVVTSFSMAVKNLVALYFVNHLIYSKLRENKELI